MPEPARWDFGALLPGVGVFGGVRRFLALGNELVRRGHRYVLYHPTGDRPGWMPFAGEVRPLATLADSRHDVLVCGEPSLVGEFASATARLKLFYCVLEKLAHERRIVHDRRWTLLANSSGIAARLRRRYRVHPEPAIGGIDLDFFRPTGPPRPPRPEPFRILAYGRLSRPRKGTAIVLRAAEALARGARRHPAWGGALAHPVQVVLFDHLGAGNERDPRPGVRARVPVEFHLDLSQEGLASLYSTCDVFVSAERRAGWNNTVAEAMACGVPVVCTSSGTRDLAHHGRTARVVPARHPWFFTRELRRLWRDPAERDRLRRAARAGLGAFTWSRLADRIEAVVVSRLTQADGATPPPAGEPERRL
jgi:glycosyltransferase involved in cell wall biosynthesis